MSMRRLFRSAQHEHAESAQRVLGVAQLPLDAPELAHLLAADPAPEVRAAAAGRCTDLAAIDLAWKTEADPAVRSALVSALSRLLANGRDNEVARAMLDADACNDEIRAEVARHAPDSERRQIAIASIRTEATLV